MTGKTLLVSISFSHKASKFRYCQFQRQNFPEIIFELPFLLLTP